ncbi:MAG: T9SS type A sorting domain-containing protein [Ignavibacteria bacterium]|nr:T9SS type A sorting domain-containing protein [Ignavibacteria bacterium]
MKKFFTLFSFLIISIFLYSTSNEQVQGEGGWREGEKQIKISADNPEHIRLLYNLKLNMDFYAPAYDYIVAYVIPKELRQIEELGIPYFVEIEDLNTFNENFWKIEEAYHTYQEIIDLADSLSTAFPNICKKIIFGYSLGNRQCAALKISDNVTIDEPEAEVIFDGGIHGNEVGGPENIIRFARDLCLQYGSDPIITNLINNREIWLYLMVNPDGRYYDTRYNNNGVDLNRDWAYMWDAWGGSTGPCSQIESKNLRSCMYSNQFVVHTTFHSGTEYISCPWSYRPDQPLDWNHIIQLAGLYSSVSGYSNLEYGQGNSGMYPINGSTKDGNYGMMSSISWSMEISNSKHPPASQIMQYYNWNYPSMLAMIEYAGYGLEGIVTDATTGTPVTAAVFVNNYYPAYSDPTAGDYHKYVLPGTYSFTVVANGYQSQTINNIVVSANSSTVTNFQLQQGGGHYVYKFAASQIPNNNPSDEGLTPAVIGPPDDINYSIGKNGWCVLDMQYPIPDGTGSDFIVYEGDTSPEEYYCYVGQTIDGPWILLGFGNGTTQFDLSSSGLTQAQFIKILDDGDGTAITPNAGFDLDAIKATDIVPVELVSFSSEVINDEVVLKWQTATETNNSGFEVEKTQMSNVKNQAEWLRISFIEGKGTTTERTDYSYNDKMNKPGTYLYRLKQLDFDGTINYSPEVEVEVISPNKFALFQNYPNPFNPATAINFSLPKQADVKLVVYNMVGQVVDEIINKTLEEGYHEVQFDAGDYASGVYYYRLKTSDFTSVKKMILLK